MPENWQDIAAKAGKMPKRFGVVESGKFYRSGMIWPRQVDTLQKELGIKNIVSLIGGNWLHEFYADEDIDIHQFAFHQRRELTEERVKNLVEFIDTLEGRTIVHCLKGSVKTGMVVAGYRILHGQKSNLGAVIEGIGYCNFNISATREIMRYSANHNV